MQESEQNTPAAGADAAATDKPTDKTVTLTEAASTAPPAGNNKLVQISEAEHMRFVALEAAERKRQADAALRGKATERLTKIKESGGECYLTEDDLVRFNEAQWDTLINMADQPQRFYGTGPTALGGGASVRESARHESSADFFERLYAGRAQ